MNMGCDIHGYIEYKRWPENESPYWDFGGCFGSRDYSMFGLMAGVRQGGCIVEPRGLPKDITRQVLWEYGLYVSDEENADDQEHTVSRERAAKWVNDGSSIWLEDKLVSGPDWHTPSYLSTEEFETCLNKRREMAWNYDFEWDAMLAAMKALPDARLVFWFDN